MEEGQALEEEIRQFLDQVVGPEPENLGLVGFDCKRFAEQSVGRTLARDYCLRDSENSRSQSLEGSQLGEKRVRSWHQTGYQLTPSPPPPLRC